MSDSNPEFLHSLRPVVLVVDLRNDNLRRARHGGGGCRAGPAMVDDRSHAWEEMLLIDLVDRQAVGGILRERELGPSTRPHRRPAGRSSRRHQRLADAWRGPSAAEAEVDRRLTLIEKRLQLRR